MLKRLRAWSWMGLLPAVVVVNLSLPSIAGLPLGIGKALGQSGGLAPAGNWEALYPAGWRDGEPMHVATDGFFVIRLDADGMSLAEAQSQLRVIARDDAGTEVLGDVSVLVGEAGSVQNTYLLGWAARQPLAASTALTVTLAVEPAVVNAAVGGQFPLVVDGDPTPLAVPDAHLEGWRKYYRGEGQSESEAASCVVAEPGQAPYSVTLPPRVVERIAATLTWTPPRVVGQVAWAPHVELRTEQGQLRERAVNPAYEVFLGPLDEGIDTLFVDDAILRDGAENYCVDLVLEDLRTGSEQRQEICSAPASLTGYSDADGDLMRCSQPPDVSELARVWCEVRGAGIEDDECGRADASQQTIPPAEAHPGLDAQGDLDPALVGCALGAPRPAPTGTALTSLAGLGLLAFLRRRRPRATL